MTDTSIPAEVRKLAEEIDARLHDSAASARTEIIATLIAASWPRGARATLRWVGRKLMCGRVCIAKIWADGPGDWVAQGGVHGDRGEFWRHDFLRPMPAHIARRYVNRRFGLPADFGEKP